MDCEERYDYSISQVAVEREIWILVNSHQEFLKLFVEDGEFEYLPVWPNASLALSYAAQDGELKPKCIALPEFQKKWIPGLCRDGLDIGVFPGKDQTVWLLEPEEFQRDLTEQLSNF
ncbi:MAG: DUF2750 domain-containing protein [Oleiphilus sp.]|nr:MAG: DUF2750 domain-containing protein [Oleiphilus sp.]